MAGSGQQKDAKRQNERIVPSIAQGSSRVSRATGAAGGSELKSATVEQRSSVSTSKPKTGSQTASGQSTRGKQGTKQGSRKDVSPSRSSATPTNSPRDTQFMEWWNGLHPHHQQRVRGVLLLALSLLLFASLTVFRTAPLLSGIARFLTAFFGWSAYLLSLGFVVFALVRLIEGIRNRQIIRWPMVVGLVCISLLLLIESRLIIGPGSVTGILAELLVRPLLGWSTAVAHVVVLGLLLIAAIFTFRITFGHVLLVGRAMRDTFFKQHQQSTSNVVPGPSPFLGQRPRFSRYGGAEDATFPSMPVVPQPARAPQRPMSPVDDEAYNDDENIEFEADFGDGDEDPLNDINIHKQEVGIVPRGLRQPAALNLDEHVNAVQGARQQSLILNERTLSSGKPLVKSRGQREMSAPEPQLVPDIPRTPQRTPRLANTVAQGESFWIVPSTVLLNSPEEVKQQMLGDDTTMLAKTIQDTLRSFRVDAEVKQEDISIGPTIIRFGIRPTGKPEMRKDEKTGKLVPVRDPSGNLVYETRTRVSRIMALQNDLALVLEAKTIRMEAPVPGRPYVGVEIPNKNSRLVTLREVLESKEYQAAKAKSKLAVALGKDVAGQVRVGDLARMPHLLIAGATGAGKSICINTIIASIVTQATPDDVRMLMVDPKMVELSMYNGIPHLLSPVVTEVEKVVPLLKNAISEMEKRYRLFSQLGVRNLDGYRKLRAEKLAQGDTSLGNLPAIVIIIDELADLMMAAPEEVEGMICRLAQLARATGIHLVVATQRPSVDVITGLIKANIPTRISFMVSSAVDSRTIIDMGGAERLLGRGDMLYLPADAGRPERIQGSFLADDEAESLVEYWRHQMAERIVATSGGSTVPVEEQVKAPVEPGWEIKEQSADDFELDDDLLEKAEEVVREYGKASISLLQRRLRIGYSRAARLIDLLEEHGIIGHSEQGGRSREVLEDGNGGGGGYGRGGGEGRTMVDEVADIMAEEKARDDFLKKQAAAGRLPYQQPQPGQGASPIPFEDDEE